MTVAPLEMGLSPTSERVATMVAVPKFEARSSPAPFISVTTYKPSNQTDRIGNMDQGKFNWQGFLVAAFLLSFVLTATLGWLAI
jgi:hypothetical protein